MMKLKEGIFAICFLSLIVLCVKGQPTDSIACSCSRVGANSTLYQIDYLYTLSNFSAPSWMAAYSSTTSGCMAYIDFTPTKNGTSFIQSQPLSSISLGESLYCYIYAGLTNDCANPAVTNVVFQCTDPYAPLPPTGPPVKLVGPISWTPLGLGLGIGALVFMLIVCIVAIILYKKKQHDREVA